MEVLKKINEYYTNRTYIKLILSIVNRKNVCSYVMSKDSQVIFTLYNCILYLYLCINNLLNKGFSCNICNGEKSLFIWYGENNRLKTV